MALVDYPESDSDSNDSVSGNSNHGSRKRDWNEKEKNDEEQPPCKKQRVVMGKESANKQPTTSESGSSMNQNDVNDGVTELVSSCKRTKIMDNSNDGNENENEETEESDSDISENEKLKMNEKNNKKIKLAFDKTKLQNAKIGANKPKRKNFLQSKYDNDKLLEKESKLQNMTKATDSQHETQHEEKSQNEKLNQTASNLQPKPSIENVDISGASKNKNKIKDKERLKRMKGQSSHATWKSETFMQLRQQFD